MDKPTYEDRDPKGFYGDPKRGAAMGRRRWYGEPSYDGDITVQEVEVDPSGYDKLGTYWGTGLGLYWISGGVQGEASEIDWCTRGVNGASVAEYVQLLYPKASITVKAEVLACPVICLVDDCDNEVVDGDTLSEQRLCSDHVLTHETCYGCDTVCSVDELSEDPEDEFLCRSCAAA